MVIFLYLHMRLHSDVSNMLKLEQTCFYLFLGLPCLLLSTNMDVSTCALSFFKFHAGFFCDFNSLDSRKNNFIYYLVFSYCYGGKNTLQFSTYLEGVWSQLLCIYICVHIHKMDDQMIICLDKYVLENKDCVFIYILFVYIVFVQRLLHLKITRWLLEAMGNQTSLSYFTWKIFHNVISRLSKFNVNKGWEISFQ